MVYEEAFDYIKAPISRLALPDAPAPASSTLEKTYYPKAQDIFRAVTKLFQMNFNKSN